MEGCRFCVLFDQRTRTCFKEQSSRETSLGVALDVASEDTSVGLEETLVMKQSLFEGATTEELGHLINSQSTDQVTF